MIKAGDVVAIRKPYDKDDWPSWVFEMDKYDGETFVVDKVKTSTSGAYVRYKNYNFNLDWLEKVKPEMTVKEKLEKVYSALAEKYSVSKVIINLVVFPDFSWDVILFNNSGNVSVTDDICYPQPNADSFEEIVNYLYKKLCDKPLMFGDNEVVIDEDGVWLDATMKTFVPFSKLTRFYKLMGKLEGKLAGEGGVQVTLGELDSGPYGKYVSWFPNEEKMWFGSKEYTVDQFYDFYEELNR